MTCERVQLAASKLVLGMASSSDLPDAAVEALQDGCDSPSLRMLAGLDEADVADAPQLLDRSLAELELQRPGKRDAAMHLARAIAKDVVAGDTHPYQGAKGIWDLTLQVSGEDVSDLDSFIYAASEWEDRPEDREAFEIAIVAAAEDLLS